MFTGLILFTASLAAPDDTELSDRPSAKEAIAQARSIKSEAQGKKGEERYNILLRAAEAYQKVAADYSAEHKVAGESWFRAGEILRILRQVEAAERCFASCSKISEAPEFGARGLQELAHISRRLKNREEALQRYAAVEVQFPDQRRECARALTWQGKVLIELKRVDEGQKTLLAVGSRFPEFPVQDIRNVDLVAMVWAKNQRPDEARALVRACIDRHSVIPEGDKEVPEKVKKALAKMKARGYLGVQ
jgi:tetratricopeptide (TPR) repeat protein